MINEKIFIGYDENKKSKYMSQTHLKQLDNQLNQILDKKNIKHNRLYNKMHYSDFGNWKIIDDNLIFKCYNNLK
jgi:hypothetical protein